MTVEAMVEPESGAIGVDRLLAAGPDARWAQHATRFGALDAAAAAPTLLAELEASGLGGRGGAGFAAWRKLAATLEAGRRPGARPVVIANGSEGEPLSHKDATLLRHAPHLVIDGLLAAAAAVGASDAYLYAAEPGLEAVRAAAAERADAARIRFVAAPDAFIAGQATAVVNAIENGVALPRDHTRRLSESGLRGRPTLLHNVETLAQLALVARYGAAWFRAVGTADDPGTRLVTIAGDVALPQVLEVAGGTRIAEVLRAAGADTSRLAAVLVGGYHGAWLPADALDAPLSPAGLAPFGAHPGAGVLLALDRTRCGVEATAGIVSYLAAQSARQCGPCRFGLPALAETWNRLAYASHDSGLAARAWELTDTVDGRGACAHPDGTARMVRSAQRVFADDLRLHAHGGCARAAR
ncbi:NADH-ubiquinone oxidoreductase-F iron-sulfur binding region domain-containing protein [Gryllotalpicola ginsengisoli]|uniref:NADH-ubiquinone oxidoreductase-F iron-sulfur binding region domain-containing protein n=1 Tax=Gryllotalpicola ginsengisoli TaxID=444608 RepID=UPI0003B31656|nr:NADH-ubiquinone oxidoreductase-F iron-sulfur binding region domain-containing protein [Gryllotalpicola ginsengisoli]